MLVALAIGCFPLLCWLLCTRSGCVRLAFLLAAVAWTTYLVAVTELLSLARSLTLVPLALAWGALLIALAATAIRLSPRVRWRRAEWVAARQWWRGEAIAVVLTAIVGILLVIALVAPPNTWDAMTYHMTRVAHWMQNGSVHGFPTHNARQVHMSPGAEFIILHLQILSGGDRLANGVQWFAMLGSLIGVSLIARSMGAAPRGQLFAAALCAGIPMAVLQAISTQNDFVAAFWIVCFVAMGLELRQALMPTPQPVAAPPAQGLASPTTAHAPRPIVLPTAAAGLSAGLAALTKSTVYLFLPAFALMLLLAAPAPLRLRVRGVGLVLLLALLVNAGFFARNLRASGSLLGPGVEDVQGQTHAYTNESFDGWTLASNLVRNLALHLILPDQSWNEKLTVRIRRAHRVLGLHPDDPRTTLSGQKFYLAGDGNHEDQAQAVLFLLLTVAATATLLFTKCGHRPLQLAYLACVAGGFLLFCIVLKWQPWHSRLLLPLLVLMTAPVAAVIEQHWPRRAQTPVVMLALIAALPSVLWNPSRPLTGSSNIFRIPRHEQYFNNRPDVRPQFRGAVTELAKSPCDRVGLVTTHDDWEYPLWVALKSTNPNVRIEHVGVTNYTKVFSRPGEPFAPCALVVMRDRGMTMRVTRSLDETRAGG